MERKRITDEIYEFFTGKLIHQFRTPKWEKIIEDDLNEIIGTYLSTVKNRSTKNGFNRGYLDGVNVGTIRTNEKFKNYIPKPESNIKNRIKFLFTGKL
tara:strand:- start:273 stop:566 length:294 start_codon:yes stop_codon:yes gene_type:complete